MGSCEVVFLAGALEAVVLLIGFEAMAEHVAWPCGAVAVAFCAVLVPTVSNQYQLWCHPSLQGSSFDASTSEQAA